jgi:SAM-dependent methyltransferase
MDIANQHQEQKQVSYWDNLVSGNTSQYKEAHMARLIDQHLKKCESIIDIGCGTCETIFKYRDKFGAKKLACMDYDQAVIEKLKQKHQDSGVEWLVQDIFKLPEFQGGFDLILLMDMIHEVYSFFGRPNRDLNLEVDHQIGISIVLDALKNVAHICNQGGAIVITDNVLTDTNNLLKVRIKNPLVKDVLLELKAAYPTKRFTFQIKDDLTFEIREREFCILLTQYNKLKSSNRSRWNVERMEIHQYMSGAEFTKTFDGLGFDTFMEIGMPPDAQKEWNEDFEVIAGRTGIPDKRITLLARKR